MVLQLASHTICGADSDLTKRNNASLTGNSPLVDNNQRAPIHEVRGPHLKEIGT